MGKLEGAIDQKAFTQSFVALKLLLAKMQDIFETVEPGPSNLQTYGHKIRELLLLAAMEVEASWTAVLKANGYVRDRFTTNDYVKLLKPMPTASTLRCGLTRTSPASHRSKTGTQRSRQSRLSGTTPITRRSTTANKTLGSQR